MDALPGELSRQCQALAAEISDRTRTVADYEIAYRQAQIETKRAIAKATVRLKGTATPIIIKCLCDGDGAVIEAQDREQTAFALMTLGKAELEGMTARFQASKKALDMKIEEVRNFRG